MSHHPLGFVTPGKWLPSWESPNEKWKRFVKDEVTLIWPQSSATATMVPMTSTAVQLMVELATCCQRDSSEGFEPLTESFIGILPLPEVSSKQSSLPPQDTALSGDTRSLSACTLLDDAYRSPQAEESRSFGTIYPYLVRFPHM